MDSIFQNPAFAQLNKGILHQVALGEAARTAFYNWLRDDAPEPVQVSYASLAEISAREHTLLALQQQSITDKTLQKWLVYKSKETALLRAIYELQHGGSYAAFKKANEALYGALDADLFNGYMHELFVKIAPDTDKQAVKAEVKALLGKVPKPVQPLMVPTPGQFAYYKGLSERYFQPLLHILNDLPAPGPDKTTPGLEVARFVQELLQALQLTDQGWEVSMRHDVDKVSVNPLSKRVHVAERDFYLSPGRLKGLLLHEVGVHVLRRSHQTGLQSQLLSTGTNQLMIEEGLGVLVEQLALDRFHSLRVFRYIALGLAMGLDREDGAPRTAHEVYQLLWRLRYMSQPTMNQEKAQHFAALEAMRVFRGIAPSVPGAVLLRDKVYGEGNNLWWKHLLAKKLDYESFHKLLSGKVANR